MIIEGNTLFEDSELEELVKLGEGMDVTLGILNLMAQEITSFYGQAGNFLTRAYIPEQEVVDGVVRIQILEGEIGDIEVTGQQKFDGQDLVDRLKRVQEERVLRESTLEKSLLELNDALELYVKAVLKPGKILRTSDMNLEVTKSRQFIISFDRDNYGSRFTGTDRLGLTGTIGNLLARDDRFSVRAVRSNEEQFFINTSYDIPLNLWGTRFGISYVVSEFNLGENGVALNAGGLGLDFFLLRFYRSWACVCPEQAVGRRGPGIERRRRGGMRINVSRWTPNYPMVTFNISVGFPIGSSFDPSDGSSHTLYLGGVILFQAK